MDAQLPGPYLYTFIAMTGLVALLVGVLTFALWRFGAAARESRRPAREGHSEQAFVTGALQDAVTRLRAQERALQQRAEASERLSDTIVRGITSGLLLVDAATSAVRIVNPAGRRLLRLGAEDDSQPPLRTLLAGAAPLALVIEECLRHQSVIVRRLVTVRLEEGEAGHAVERHLGVTVSPLHNPDGSLQAAICLFTDLTTVLALEEQVKLKDSLARLGELTAGLAHEFRNGLSTIHGYARLLDPERLESPHDGYVRALREETEALGQVVTNFLNFAKPTKLALATVDLDHLVSKVTDDFHREAEVRGGSVRKRGRFAQVEGDEVLLRQALSNLCRNALEACEGAGLTPQVVVEGEAEGDGGMAVVRVRDNGPGLSAGVSEQVFKPFFTTKATGTGLGLALAQKIAVTHNGLVAASNRPEGGAAFELRLPARAWSPASVN